MSDPIDNLFELADLVEREGSPELRQWLVVNGVPRFMAGEDLAEALGLRGAPGHRSAVSRYRRHQQHRHLRTAWNTLSGLPWPRAAKLAEAIREFQSNIWPAWRELSDPPKGASRLHAALFRARQAGPLPEGQRRLHDLLRDTTETSSAAWFSRSLL